MSTEQAAAAGANKSALQKYGRPLLLLLGLGALVFVIASAGPRRVADAVLAAAPWMPGIVALDAFYFVGESLAHRALMGHKGREIPRALFLRTLFLSYALSVLLPLGRASVEVTRVAAYRKHVGAGRAAAASVSVHAVSIFANALLCFGSTIAAARTLGPKHVLTLTLLALTLGMAAIATLTVLLMRRSRMGRWVGERIPSLHRVGIELDEALSDSPSSLGTAIFWCTASRASQVVQSALLIAAVGGTASLTTALLGQGIHIVGSTVGEAVPAQTGVIEASYRVFASTLGFAADPARAVAIALLIRVSQIVVASTSLALLALVPALRRAGAELQERPDVPLREQLADFVRTWGLQLAIIALALVINLGKAVHIDDAAHLAVAKEIIAHPLHPMSGTVYWGSHPEPIHALNQPPGLYFLLGGVMALFGADAIWAQHLVIAAFVALAVFAFFDLAGRLLPAAWVPFAALALFVGPAFLPSQNLMTDVPLLALWLAFFAALDRAHDDTSAGAHAHLAAALLAGAACLVKYTSLVLIGVLMLDWWVSFRRRHSSNGEPSRQGRGFAPIVPIAMLLAWSAWNLWDYGGIHLIGRHVEVGNAPSALAAIGIVIGRGALWIVTLGAIAPFVLALAPNRVGARFLGAAVVFMLVTTALGQLAARLVPEHLGGETVLHSALRGAFLGIGVLAVVALRSAVGSAGLRWRELTRGALPTFEERRTLLLVYWLGGSFVFIVVLSPFISVRHVLLAVPAVLLLLLRAAPAPTPSMRARAVVWLTVPLSLGVAIADARYADVYRAFAAQLPELRTLQRAPATAWTVGHWGWQWYAERAGMREYDSLTSKLVDGDLLIRPRIVDQQPIAPKDKQRLVLVDQRVIAAKPPLDWLRTVTSRQGFYAVWGGLPWTLTNEPLETFEIWKVSAPASPAMRAPAPTKGHLADRIGEAP